MQLHFLYCGVCFLTTLQRSRAPGQAWVWVLIRLRSVGWGGWVRKMVVQLGGWRWWYIFFFKESSCLECVGLGLVGVLNVFLRHDGSRPSVQSSVNCLISFTQQMADAASDAEQRHDEPRLFNPGKADSSFIPFTDSFLASSFWILISKKSSHVSTWWWMDRLERAVKINRSDRMIREIDR